MMMMMMMMMIVRTASPPHPPPVALRDLNCPKFSYRENLISNRSNKHYFFLDFIIH